MAFLSSPRSEVVNAAWREHYKTFADYPPHERARRVIAERIAQAIERRDYADDDDNDVR